jgi:hypothetical protein
VGSMDVSWATQNSLARAARKRPLQQEILPDGRRTRD